jgi:acylphosphatase
VNGDGTGSAGSAGSKVVRVHVFVEGWVQGVSFRYNTMQEAGRLGVDGWVRNLPDGRVEAVYEGPRDTVDEMLAWTRRGPRWAQVARVAIHDEAPTGERGFSVR